MSSLYVFYKSILVGTLTKLPDATMSFQYETEWLNDPNSFALSPALNLNQTEGFNHRQSLAFFENLIPEGDVKDRLEKIIGKSLSSSYQFLHEYGADCAGAFVISPIREMPNTVLEDAFEGIDMLELAKAHKNNENLMVHVLKNHNGRFSLAGAQDKVPVNLFEEGVFIPIKGAPTTHIIKPPHLSKSVKDSVYNEYFCMKLAKSSGLDVADVDIIEGEVPFYVVERYDRIIVDDVVNRLHQIDFCQAQNRLVSEKYESDGGPTLKDNFKTIEDYSSQAINDLRRFMKWVCFNLIIGNNDCHSKNISFLRVNGKLKVSPFYDLLCTSIYKEYNAEFAFKIGENSFWGQWNKSHFEKEVRSWGLERDTDILYDTFLSMKDMIVKVLDREVDIFKERFPDIKVAGRIKKEILTRIKSFEKRFED